MVSLGLNIIVGPDESDILERCLKSCAGGLFDEIVVTVTCDDPRVLKVAQEYATVVPHFKWVDDFSAARNFSFSHATTDWVLWLDSDDVIHPDQYKLLLDLKPQLSDAVDSILCDYVYQHDDAGRPVLTLPRERIIRRAAGLKWHDPIHEYIDMPSDPARVARVTIHIDHYRERPYDPQRNLRLLKKIYDSGTASPRSQFYYGKELAECGDTEIGVKILEAYLSTDQDWADNQAIACYRVSHEYLKRGSLDLAIQYANQGIRRSAAYAECWCVAAAAYRARGDVKIAEEYYLQALSKKFGAGGMSQLAPYYAFIPHRELSTLYYDTDKFQDALAHCDAALLVAPQDAETLQLRASIEAALDRTTKQRTLRAGDLEALQGAVSGLHLSVETNNVRDATIQVKRARPLSICWMIPSVNIMDPPTRIRRLNVCDYMTYAGTASKVVTGYYGHTFIEIESQLRDSTCIIFTQFSAQDLELMRAFKKQGRTVVFDHCEGIFHYPLQDECMQEADAIICCSTELARMTRAEGFHRTIVIKDPIEPESPKISKSHTKGPGDRPVAVYMGGGGNSFLATQWLKPIVEAAGYELITITEWDDATVQYRLDTWPDEFIKGDVALCPQRADIQPGKSNVKVTTAMAAGLPVIASPLPAYKEIIENAVNGYIAETENEWYNALFMLSLAGKRTEVANEAMKCLGPYRLKAIAAEWCARLQALQNGEIEFEYTALSKKPSVHPVDIIISTYENVDYLKLCIQELHMNTLYPYNIIISDGGSGQEVWDYLRTLKGITIIGKQGERRTYSQTNNAGLLASTSPYVCLLNSDVIVSKGWLNAIMQKMLHVDRLGACGVLSNCDRGWLHGVESRPSYPMSYTCKIPPYLKGFDGSDSVTIDLHPGMKMHEISPYLEGLRTFMSESNQKLSGHYIDQKWVATYATVFARAALVEIGIFDEQYKNGCEDLDLMTRLSKAGYRIGQALDSFVLHFGGVSRGAYQSQDRETYDSEDALNHRLYAAKWARPKIGIFCGPAYEPWGPSKVEAGMGGSETWATYIARAFSDMGYEVRIYGHMESPDQIIIDEPYHVKYLNYTELQRDTSCDVLDLLISSRTVEPLKINVHAARNVVMVHDIWLHTDTKADMVLWRGARYACLSNWHKAFLMQHHHLPADRLFITANGLSPAEAWQSTPESSCIEKKKNQMVWSSSPDRGLYQFLEQVYPAIKKSVPDFELIVTYGFDNWEAAAQQRNDEPSKVLITMLKATIESSGVKYVGRVSKTDLARLQKESKVWCYPTWFSETFCITAIENMSAGNPVICSDLAGLQTTVADAGVRIPVETHLSRDELYPQSFVDRFVEETVRVLTDDSHRDALARRAFEHQKKYRWDKIAREFLKEVGL